MNVLARPYTCASCQLLRRGLRSNIVQADQTRNFSNTTRMATWKRLVRFVPKSDSSKVLIGQPTDEKVDVGVAVRDGKEVEVDVFSGSSVLSPGSSSGEKAVIERILSPLTQNEVGTIRCIGLNVSDVITANIDVS